MEAILFIAGSIYIIWWFVKDQIRIEKQLYEADQAWKRHTKKK